MGSGKCVMSGFQKIRPFGEAWPITLLKVANLVPRDSPRSKCGSEKPLAKAAKMAPKIR